MIALFFAIIVSANQGSAVELTFPAEPGVKSVEVACYRDVQAADLSALCIEKINVRLTDCLPNDIGAPR